VKNHVVRRSGAEGWAIDLTNRANRSRGTDTKEDTEGKQECASSLKIPPPYCQGEKGDRGARFLRGLKQKPGGVTLNPGDKRKKKDERERKIKNKRALKGRRRRPLLSITGSLKGRNPHLPYHRKSPRSPRQSPTSACHREEEDGKEGRQGGEGTREEKKNGEDQTTRWKTCCGVMTEG